VIAPLGKCILERAKCCMAVRNEDKSVRSSTSVTIKVREGREEVLQVPEQRFPCRPWRGHSGAGIHTAAHGGGPWWSSYFPAAHPEGRRKREEPLCTNHTPAILPASLRVGQSIRD